MASLSLVYVGQQQHTGPTNLASGCIATPHEALKFFASRLVQDDFDFLIRLRHPCLPFTIVLLRDFNFESLIPPAK